MQFAQNFPSISAKFKTSARKLLPLSWLAPIFAHVRRLWMVGADYLGPYSDDSIFRENHDYRAHHVGNFAGTKNRFDVTQPQTMPEQ